MRRILLSVFLFGCSQCLFAQIDTTLQFPTVEIAAPRLRSAPPGERVEQWDSMSLVRTGTENVAELLSRQSGVFIKTYGLGSSATSSIRGGSAGQTSVIWNGLPLQSPMLGQLDLSLLPVHFIDQMSVRYGGNGASWGSGAIGGVITLHNQPKYGIGQAVDLISSAGSFGRWDQQLKWQYGQQKLAGATRVFYQQAKNDFPYSIRPDLPTRQQSNAAVRQAGILQEVYWRNRPDQELSLQIWTQQTEREIPPLTTQTRSEARQEDAFLRSALHWKRHGQHGIIEARTGFFWENQYYSDAQTGADNTNRFLTAMADLDGQWQLTPSRKFQINVHQIYTRATTEAYHGTATQYRIAFFGAFQQKWGRWTAQLGIRQEMVDGKGVPIVPHLSMEGKVWPWLTLKGKMARNYRLPSLNDLYWRPGGNPDLEAESGWSTELGLSGQWEMGTQLFRYSLTGFHRRIHNWLLWSLQEGASFWSASNIAEVWSRGVEQRLSWEKGFANGHWQLSAGHDLTWSTNEKAIQAPTIKAGQQLFYTPKHQAFASIDFSCKNWNLYYQHQYTGPVTTLSDPLEGYQVGNCQVQYNWRHKQWRGGLLLQINNCWNAQYRVIERRPMPGRHFQIGLRLGYRQPRPSDAQ